MNNTENYKEAIKANRLSPKESSQLRARHPLYTRLSGDVVWTLLEELGYGPEECDKAMDCLISTMHSTLTVMDRLEKRENGESYLGFKSTGPVCAQGLTYFQKVISLETLNWRQFLPPFSIGCTLHAIALTEAEFQKTENTSLLVPEVSTAPFTLLCPLLDPE